MFNDPQLYQKLANNPKTSPYLTDPTFMAKIQKLAKDPNQMDQELGDPRILQVMSVLGLDLSMGDPSAGGPAARGQEREEDVPIPAGPTLLDTLSDDEGDRKVADPTTDHNAMYITSTISEDRTGNQEGIARKRLAALGARCVLRMLKPQAEELITP
jgi:STI1 domain